MKCPACPQAELKRIPYERFQVLFCLDCHGHLVALRRLEALKRQREKPVEQLKHEVSIASWQESDSARRCPKCRKVMELSALRPPASFNLEVCRDCELAWFDGTELARYQLAHEAELSSPSATKAGTAGDAGDKRYREWEQAYEDGTFDEPSFLDSVSYMIREMFRK